jgi:hypothetical protein
MPFFHEASHRKTMRSCAWRACSSSPSTSVKSKLPSLGSISSQLSGVTTAFSPIAFSRGQIGFIYSRLDDEELCSSPDSIRKRLAVHDQLGRRAALFQVRRRRRGFPARKATRY